MLNGGSMVWGFCVYFVYMIPLETDVLRKHRFQKWLSTHSQRRHARIQRGGGGRDNHKKYIVS